MSIEDELRLSAEYRARTGSAPAAKGFQGPADQSNVETTPEFEAYMSQIACALPAYARR
jgi:hypothetical protein